MLAQFIRHIREKNLLDQNSRYLLAISGGIDSTVLARLLKEAGISFALAHCNFGLRGEESDGDEEFVREMAVRLKVDIFVKKMDALPFASEKGISTLMAARDLRYAWFEQLVEEEGFEGLISAHHFDDQLETVLLNLLRGTGIEGIYGMAARRENIIRPLLPFSREELEQYAGEEKIEWREDSSNNKTAYKRNYLRHKVFPGLKSFSPVALQMLGSSFERIKDTGKAFFYLYDNWLDNVIQKEAGFRYMDLAKVQQVPGKKSLLYYWLRQYGFNFAQVEDLVGSIERMEVGKCFMSEEYLLNLDREHLILGVLQAEIQETEISKSEIALSVGSDQYDLITHDYPVKMDSSKDSAMLDKGLLEFPLSVRNWQEGDRFMPLGMKKWKKLSDFLIDLKTPLIQKKNVKVLCSGGEIAWVIGYRIDERFKLTSSTKSVLYIKKR